MNDKIGVWFDGASLEHSTFVAPQILKNISSNLFGKRRKLGRFFTVTCKRIKLGCSFSCAENICVLTVHFKSARPFIMHRHRVRVVAGHVVIFISYKLCFRCRWAFVVCVMLKLPFCIPLKPPRKRKCKLPAAAVDIKRFKSRLRYVLSVMVIPAAAVTRIVKESIATGA